MTDPTRAFDLLILDFDGVLADSAEWVVGQMAEMAVKHRFKMPDAQELERLRGLSNREVVKAMKVPFWKLPAIARDMRGRLKANPEAIGLFPGAPAFLQRTSAAGLRLAIVSSNDEPNIRAILGEVLAERIGIYACGASLFGKARLFEQVIRQTGVERARVLAVGDETRDIEAAQKARIRSVAVSWGYATVGGLQRARPDWLVADFDALTDLALSKA